MENSPATFNFAMRLLALNKNKSLFNFEDEEMREQTKSYWKKQLLFAAVATVVFIFTGNFSVNAQGQFKPGDRVECDPSGIGDWLKGSVVDYLEKDEPVFQGKYYLTRVLIEKWKASYPEGVLCQTERVRPLKGETVKPPPNPIENEPDEENEPQENQFGAKYKPGDRVECDTMAIGKWFKGTVLPFLENDEPEKFKDKTGKFFYIHRVRLDNEASTRPAGGMCFTDRTRLLSGGAAAKSPPVDKSVGEVTVDENNTLSADRPILDCPVEQTKVKNGARPDGELIKKIIRCDKGEIPAQKGLDGAVTVDVTALQIGASRPWIYAQDIGGKPGMIIYPVKVTYTVKTFYRNRTEVNENWIRIINFYVNDFGEWQSGSEEPVKSPQIKDIPRFPN